MSLTRVGPENLEVTTLLLQPSQSFVTSSLGMTGSIRLVNKPSPTLKLFERGGVFGYAKYTETAGVTNDDDLLYEASTSTDTDITGTLESYMQNVRASSVESRQTVIFHPTSSFSPGTTGTPPSSATETFNVEDSLQYERFQRNVIKNCLIPDQIVQNPKSNYAYTNYHCLNFMSTSNAPTGSALIYPNFDSSYTFENDFSIDFFVKPKAQYTNDSRYANGTILHMTSSICVSLISGTTGPDGKCSTFKLLLQTYSDANKLPYEINLASLPSNTFVTEDVMKRDTWHHVTIRWSKDRSDGTGSIKIDDYSKSFVSNAVKLGTCSALFVGNYYRSVETPEKFFNPTEATNNGTIASGETADPTLFSFPAPLNAELHQLSIFHRYITTEEIDNIDTTASLTGADGPVFYLPVVFTGSTEQYKNYDSPTVASVTAQDSPVNYKLSLGYNTNFTNIQNFLVDEVTKRLPRAYGYHSISTATSYDLRTDDTDNVIVGLSASNRKRSYFVTPCDNGKFEPKYVKLNTESRFYLDDRGEYDQSMLSLNNLATYSQASFDRTVFYGSMNYTGAPSYLPLLQNRNATSNNSTSTFTLTATQDISLVAPLVITIPTPYYGTRIVPGTFTLSDTNVEGSGGMHLTLRDDGIGNLYRNDATTPAAWNRVGAIFYDHGIVCILNPHISRFGKTGYSMNFRGETRKSVASYTVIAGSGQFNMSKNPTYKAFPPTQQVSEPADSFVYITGINLHDENLNVIMRGKLAQPVKKRDYDELAFRLRYDF
jgi:hypothetical protein